MRGRNVDSVREGKQERNGNRSIEILGLFPSLLAVWLGPALLEAGGKETAAEVTEL